jgi:hypothetical protein
MLGAAVTLLGAALVATPVEDGVEPAPVLELVGPHPAVSTAATASAAPVSDARRVRAVAYMYGCSSLVTEHILYIS